MRFNKARWPPVLIQRYRTVYCQGIQAGSIIGLLKSNIKASTCPLLSKHLANSFIIESIELLYLFLKAPPPTKEKILQQEKYKVPSTHTTLKQSCINTDGVAQTLTRRCFDVMCLRGMQSAGPQAITLSVQCHYQGKQPWLEIFPVECHT